MSLRRSTVQGVVALGLALVLPVSWAKAAEDHIVPPSELRGRIADAAEARLANLEKMNEFLSLKPVAKALHASKINGSMLRLAVASLNDDELRMLAEKAGKAQADLAAGSLSNQELTYIVIALATAVLILVIVAAR